MINGLDLKTYIYSEKNFDAIIQKSNELKEASLLRLSKLSIKEKKAVLLDAIGTIDNLLNKKKTKWITVVSTFEIEGINFHIDELYNLLDMDVVKSAYNYDMLYFRKGDISKAGVIAYFLYGIDEVKENITSKDKVMYYLNELGKNELKEELKKQIGDISNLFHKKSPFDWIPKSYFIYIEGIKIDMGELYDIIKKYCSKKYDNNNFILKGKGNIYHSSVLAKFVWGKKEIENVLARNKAKKESIEVTLNKVESVKNEKKLLFSFKKLKKRVEDYKSLIGKHQEFINRPELFRKYGVTLDDNYTKGAFKGEIIKIELPTYIEYEFYKKFGVKVNNKSVLYLAFIGYRLFGKRFLDYYKDLEEDRVFFQEISDINNINFNDKEQLKRIFGGNLRYLFDEKKGGAYLQNELIETSKGDIKLGYIWKQFLKFHNFENKSLSAGLKGESSLFLAEFLYEDEAREQIKAYRERRKEEIAAYKKSTEKKVEELIYDDEELTEKKVSKNKRIFDSMDDVKKKYIRNSLNKLNKVLEKNEKIDLEKYLGNLGEKWLLAFKNLTFGRFEVVIDFLDKNNLELMELELEYLEDFNNNSNEEIIEFLGEEYL